MDHNSQNKILIAGPTGTGTTFLLALLHRLGFETGFDDAHVDKVTSGRGKGLEYVRGKLTRNPWLVEKEKGRDISPQVIKQPIQDHGDDGGTGIICDVLDIADENDWIIRHLFVTVRNLTSVVESIARRVKKGDYVMYKVKGDEAKRQRELLAAEGFYKMACKLAVRDHPYTLIEFPESVYDPEYCFGKLKPVLNSILHPLDKFVKVHQEVARKDLVHIK